MLMPKMTRTKIIPNLIPGDQPWLKPHVAWGLRYGRRAGGVCGGIRKSSGKPSAGHRQLQAREHDGRGTFFKLGAFFHITILRPFPGGNQGTVWWMRCHCRYDTHSKFQKPPKTRNMCIVVTTNTQRLFSSGDLYKRA